MHAHPDHLDLVAVVMLTVSGHLLELPPGFEKANTKPPKLTPEEEKRRKALLTSIRHHDKGELKKCETDDRSAPLVSGTWEDLVALARDFTKQHNCTLRAFSYAVGKRSTEAGWSESNSSGSVMAEMRSALRPAKQPPGVSGRGRGRGAPALGDLFAGGFRPNPGALKGAAGRGRAGAR